MADPHRVRNSYLALARRVGAAHAPALEEIASAPERADERAPMDHARSLEEARVETGVDLSTSRVRVGFSRGHLLEVVVQVPLDVSGEPERLQVAAEVYCECRVGSSILDVWVGSMSVDRISRTRGLLMASDVASGAAHHPLEAFADLMSRGTEGVSRELPASLLLETRRADEWTALEIPQATEALQPDRRFASTRFPEALKCALEGLPFSSLRFTRGREVFSWLSWQAPPTSEERLRIRKGIEMELLDLDEKKRLVFAGSGFGPERDYCDLWLDLDSDDVPLLLQRLARATTELKFGVYDTPLSSVPLGITVE